ncbi:DUF6115 domain-containing protein [Alteribacter natronophilus]|uniref:DUF6115 domain-containing protein n=1 Tax=Alteribacter natronophilus TaxID=2583810 RepID=UPI001AEEDB57|nr:hypothetical protein [Alteribacter natronophilus]
MVYFIILSLLLHLLSFYMILLLSKKNREMPDMGAVREMEDLLAAYTEEMKDSNEKLIGSLKRYSDSGASGADTAETSGTSETSEPFKQTAAVQEPVYTPPMPGEQEPESVSPAISARVLELAGRGLSDSEIGKELGIGKGEVSLYRKFYYKS